MTRTGTAAILLTLTLALAGCTESGDGSAPSASPSQSTVATPPPSAPETSLSVPSQAPSEVETLRTVGTSDNVAFVTMEMEGGTVVAASLLDTTGSFSVPFRRIKTGPLVLDPASGCWLTDGKLPIWLIEPPKALQPLTKAPMTLSGDMVKRPRALHKDVCPGVTQVITYASVKG